MIYITKNDLVTDSFERLIDESTPEGSIIIDDAEKRSIEEVKGYLSVRYNTSEIFKTPNPIINTILVDIIVKITLYRIFKRNAARKIPSDIKEDYEAAIKQLTAINQGKLNLEGLPPAEDANGKIISNSIFGNNSNPDFYI